MIWNIFKPRLPKLLVYLGFALAIYFRISDWVRKGEIFRVKLILLFFFVVIYLWIAKMINPADAQFVLILVLAFPAGVLVLCFMVGSFVGIALHSLWREKLNLRKMKQRMIENQDKSPEERDRLRGVPILGLSWFVWVVIYQYFGVIW